MTDVGTAIDELPDASPEIADLVIARDTYPDLRAYRDPGGRLRVCTPEVNALVTDVEMDHDSEGNLWVTPYLVDAAVVIAGSPPVTFVGAYNRDGFGDIQFPDWEEGFRSQGYPELVISRVKDYFAQHPAINW